MHVSFHNDDPTTINPADPMSGFAGIPRNMTGLAAKLKTAGCETGRICAGAVRVCSGTAPHLHRDCAY